MQILVALVPVVVFLIVLILLDSFKLVRFSLLILCLVWGIGSAILSYFINSGLDGIIPTDPDRAAEILSKYIAPIIEESLKMILLIALINRGRIGFMVDGAIYGFAIGCGFAILENIFYLHQVHNTNIFLWMVRGFGTAIMHGGTTSVIAIIIMNAYDRQRRFWHSLLRGWLVAIVIHSFYNHFVLPPLVMMVSILTVISLTEIVVFRMNEGSLRRWLQLEFDSEVKLLAMIRKGKFSQSKSGEYLISIKNRFSQLVVFDMLAYISLYLELSIKAKGNLMLHEAGLPVPKDSNTLSKLGELRSLEKNIGATGLLAIIPILRTSKKDLWKWSVLK
jgi:RsiW-degrading membrane proteinase PrsW (M82 family)